MSTLLERLRAALAPEYEVERELGSGGMGMVFLGRDTGLDRLVAVSRRVQEIIGRALPGQIVKAGPSTRKYPVPDTVAGRLSVAPRA